MIENPDVKLVYVKRWRTIVPLPAKYADEIVEALRASPAATPVPNGRAKVIQLLWEKQFEGSPWHSKFHLIRPDSLEKDYGALTDAIIAALCSVSRPHRAPGGGE